MASQQRTAAWRAHPNALGPVSMLLEIHEQFRAVSQRLVQLVAQQQGAAALARVFLPLAQVLHHHHHAEEVMVFPLVHRRTGVAPAQLQLDHDELTAAIDAVETGLAARANDVGAAITRFDEILVAHLDREEELVIPVFLEMQPHEAWALMHR